MSTGTPPSLSGIGACVPCYQQGQVTLAMDPIAGSVCRHHATHPDEAERYTELDDACAPGLPSADTIRRGPRARMLGRGRSARPTRSPDTVRDDAIRLARRRRIGRERAAQRLQRSRTHVVRAGSETLEAFAPHPGWRNFIPPGWRVLTDQTETLKLLRELVDAEHWRCDRAHAWWQILSQLVRSMDWDTGLITAVTADKLAAAGARTSRTVSRVIAWLQDVDALVVIEPGASAAWLGTTFGRTPTYALITNTPAPAPPLPYDPTVITEADDDPQVRVQNGDLPISDVELTTRTRRINHTRPDRTSWPAWQIPQTPAERTSAARRLLDELGLGARGRHDLGSKINLRRWWALLRPWWDAGWSPRGLAWAITHHPDAPGRTRGSLADARDLVGLIGHRLRSWRGRVTDLPPAMVGLRQSPSPGPRCVVHDLTPPAAHVRPDGPTGSLAAVPRLRGQAAAEAQADIAALLAELARTRTARGRIRTSSDDRHGT